MECLGVGSFEKLTILIMIYEVYEKVWFGVKEIICLFLR
jgi:hypothetical protein